MAEVGVIIITYQCLPPWFMQLKKRLSEAFMICDNLIIILNPEIASVPVL